MAINGANPARTRQQRVATVELPPGPWARLWANLRRGSVLVRLFLCLSAAIVLWLITRGWAPPFEYHLGMVPERNILPRTSFTDIDEKVSVLIRRGICRVIGNDGQFTSGKDDFVSLEAKPDFVVKVTSNVWKDIIAQKRSGALAFASGDLKIVEGGIQGFSRFMASFGRE